MVKKTHVIENVTKIAKQYGYHLRSKGITLDQVVLFGSWAKGKENLYSDIDLGIISPEFGKDEIKELQFLLYETRKVDDRIEPIPISTDDFQSDATPLVIEIKKTGKIIEL